MKEIYIVITESIDFYDDEAVNVFDSDITAISYASSIASSSDNTKVKKIIQLNTDSLRGTEMELYFNNGKFELIKVPLKRKNS